MASEMNEPLSASTSALLAQSGWVRRLARSLVADPNEADDLAQEALAVGLEKQPDASHSLRAWLARVLRTLALQRSRGESHRWARERGAARVEALPSTTDALERLSLHRELTRQVCELREPYRSTILARYFDELPPRRIAELHAVSVKTVDARLARGREQLRLRLEKEYGRSGTSWQRAFAPLLVLPKSSASSWPWFAAAAGIAGLVGGATMVALGPPDEPPAAVQVSLEAPAPVRGDAKDRGPLAPPGVAGHQLAATDFGSGSAAGGEAGGAKTSELPGGREDHEGSEAHVLRPYVPGAEGPPPVPPFTGGGRH